MEEEALHPCEVRGRDIHAQVEAGCTVFRDILVGDDFREKHASITVSAAPIRHTCPTLGFVLEEEELDGLMPASYLKAVKAHPSIPKSVLREVKQGASITLPDGQVLHPPAKMPGRKLCILGDTCDPSNIASLAMQSDVLVHEATNALVKCDPQTRPGETYENVQSTTIAHGHSTPQMAGDFAARIHASTLILNHFSARYKGDSSELSNQIMDEIMSLAQQRVTTCSVHTARDWSSFGLTRKKELVANGVMSKYAT